MEKRTLVPFTPYMIAELVQLECSTFATFTSLIFFFFYLSPSVQVSLCRV